MPQSHLNDLKLVATVNNEPVLMKELLMSEQKCKASIIQEFKLKYKLNYDDNFWQNKNFVISPFEVLKNKALELAIEIKIQQILARQYGLVKDISYTAFLNDLKVENDRRKKATLNKSVFFGPTQFSEENYFDYKYSNLIISLKRLLADSLFKVQDDKIRSLYENEKDSLYKLTDFIQVLRIDVIKCDNSNYVNLGESEEINMLISIIKSQLLNGTFDINEFNKPIRNKWYIKTLIQNFDPLSYQNMEGEEKAEILSQINNLSTDKFSSVTKRTNCYRMYQVLQRNSMGYKTFESAKNSLKDQYISSSYRNYISTLRKKSIIVQY